MEWVQVFICVRLKPSNNIPSVSLGSTYQRSVVQRKWFLWRLGAILISSTCQMGVDLVYWGVGASSWPVVIIMCKSNPITNIDDRREGPILSSILMVGCRRLCILLQLPWVTGVDPQLLNTPSYRGVVADSSCIINIHDREEKYLS